MAIVPFAQWGPDAPDFGTFARIASGVIPEAAGYRPFKALATTSTALTARAQGAAWFRAPDRSTVNFAGDATKLYKQGTGGTWANVTHLAAAVSIQNITRANPAAVSATAHGLSTNDTVYISGVVGMTQVNSLFFTATRVDADHYTLGVDSSAYTAYSSGGTGAKVVPYAMGATDNWRFAQFQSTAFATNCVDNLQSFDLTSGTFWADATGSPPVCKFVAVVRNFLVLANISTAPQKVVWSGDNNVTTFATSATTGSDSQTLPDGGEITGFVGGEFGVVLQESAIRRMSFEGSPTWFRFDKVANDVGCTIPNTVAGWGPLAFFCHRSGFYMLTGGQQLAPIGRDRVDRWFWAMVDQTNLHRVSCAVDPLNSLYIVSFPTGTSGTPTTIIVYNWKADRWSYATITCEMIYSGATQQVWSLEDLDAFVTLEAVPYSLDSSYWTGTRQLLLAGFYTDHKSGTFSGDNLAIQIDTEESQPIDGRRGRIRSVRPMIDGGTPSVAVGTRNTQQGTVGWTGARAINSFGLVPVNASGRYARFRVTQPSGATWFWAQGISEIDARPTGFR